MYNKSRRIWEIRGELITRKLVFEFTKILPKVAEYPVISNLRNYRHYLAAIYTNPR